MANISDKIQNVVKATCGASAMFETALRKRDDYKKAEAYGLRGRSLEQAFIARAAGDTILTVKELITALKAAKPEHDCKASRLAREELVFQLEDLDLQGKGHLPAVEIITDPFGEAQIVYKDNLQR